MRDAGRFIFDSRPAKRQELQRLLDLSKVYHSHTEDLLCDIATHTRHEIRNVIDIGAGTGHSTILLKNLFPQASVTYFDASSELLDFARRFAEERDVEISFILGDILDFDFTERYDLIFCRFALKHFYAPEKAVQTMCRMLEPSGIICLVDKDVYANVWYPRFPLYRTKFMKAINQYNDLPTRGGDSAIGRKMRKLLSQHGVRVKNEVLWSFNLNDTDSDMADYRKIYVQVYENLVPELVSSGLISETDANADIARLRLFLADKTNTSIVIDFATWGVKYV